MKWILAVATFVAICLAEEANKRASDAQARLWAIEQKLNMHR